MASACAVIALVLWAIWTTAAKQCSAQNSLARAYWVASSGCYDLRREPIEDRKAALARLIRPQHHGIRFVEHLEFDDGEMIFEHACELGCEGIVSKRLGLAQSGTSSGEIFAYDL
jgi:hypothetical protein